MEKIKKFGDDFLHLVLSLDKNFIIILLLTLAGFIFRIVAAINQGVSADDMHFAPGAINFISSSKLIYWDQSSGLWFLLTDFFYKIFGITQLGSRFSAVLFGTFLIPLMFLFSKELLKKDRVAIFAAALTAFSPFIIKSMMAEMDVTAMFFSIFSMYLFIKAINNKYSKSFFIISGILIGLAVYTKVYPLLFIPGMILYLLYNLNKEKKFSWPFFIKLSLCILIPAFIFCIPALTHNYLLYKDKGIMDHQFTRVFGSEDKKAEYSWVAGNSAKFNPIVLILPISGAPEGLPALLWMVKWFFILDPLVFILGIIGFIILRKNKDRGIFMLLSSFFLIIYMGSIMNLSKHYLFLSLFFIPAAALAIDNLSEKFSKIKIEYIIILLIFIFSFFYLGSGILGSSVYTKSEIASMMDYKKNNIPTESLVVVDSRIYRGPIAWMFNGRHYLEANYLDSLNSINSSNRVATNVYYIECAIDDCGWGTIKDQPDFNKSMEQLSEFFRNISQENYTIYSKGYSNSYYLPFMKSQKSPYYYVYKTTLNLPVESLALADSTHVWWMYPLGYDKKIVSIFDDYTISGTTDDLLDKLAHFLRSLSIILAFTSFILLFYFLITNLRLSENSKSDILMSHEIIDKHKSSNNNSSNHLVNHHPVN